MTYDDTPFEGIAKTGKSNIRFWAKWQSASHIKLSIDSDAGLEEQNIDFVMSEHPWGHQIMRFICPCGNKTEKLYLPENHSLLLCRECHGLTYKSSQTAHKYDVLIREFKIPDNIANAIKGDPVADKLLQMLVLRRMMEKLNIL